MQNADMIANLRGCRLPAWDLLPDFGLYMDQLVTFVSRALPDSSRKLELTSNMINNYVKAGLIDKPDGKKYSRESLAQLPMISLLKPTTPLDLMKPLLHPGGDLKTEEIYSAFRDAQERISEEIIRRDDQPAMVYALESACLQSVLRRLLSP